MLTKIRYGTLGGLGASHYLLQPPPVGRTRQNQRLGVILLQVAGQKVGRRPNPHSIGKNARHNS